MRLLISFLLGLLFGIGLLVSGMSNPAKVLGFLDLSGLWDPSLAFVMGGAVTVGLIGFRLIRKRKTALLGDPLQLPTGTRIESRLIIGGGLFGIGWGLAGICPGPALVLPLAGHLAKGVIFVAAMLVGMLLFSLLERAKTARS